MTELDGNAARITDLARATIVANDVSSLMVIELPKTGIIAEVQFHLKAIADVKNGAEHKLYEQIQHIERVAKREQRPLTSLETAKIKRMRSESKNLATISRLLCSLRGLLIFAPDGT